MERGGDGDWDGAEMQGNGDWMQGMDRGLGRGLGQGHWIVPGPGPAPVPEPLRLQ